MTSSSPLDVLFIWHLHQPYYRIPGRDEFVLPWVRLHAVKAYYDMAWLLERRPEIKATFNFSGSLLRQLVEINDLGLRDRWWRWSKTDPDELQPTQRQSLLQNFFSINHQRAILPVPRYAELLQRRQDEGFAAAAHSFSRQELLDLQVLFNLAWCGFAARQDFPLLGQLHAKGRDFTIDDRDALLELHLDIVARILPLYRDLACREQIEISVTPLFHPILPLLIDTDSASRATPDRPLPERFQAPDDARWHIEESLDLAKACFGTRPRGLWPSEGSVSPEALDLIADAGLSWIATDEDILRCSRGDKWQRYPDLFRSWTFGEHPTLRLFFRDHGLSDQIGFVYANNPADEAAEDLVTHLRNIHRGTDDNASVAIILDGENPWEYYDDDGRPFLTALYDRLAGSPELRTTLPSTLTDQPSGHLDHLHSGSWIMANYQIWIGHKETNAAWDWVRRAREYLDSKGAESPDHPGLEDATLSLRIAQGSDWFWWYGDDFSSEQDEQFDALFRALIARVWTAFGETPPARLTRPLHQQQAESADQDKAFTPPRRFISPTIDGRRGDYFDWIGAGQIIIAGGHGSMYENFRPLEALYFGFSPDRFFLRLDPGPDFSAPSLFQIHFRADGSSRQLTFSLGPQNPHPEGITAAFDQRGELAISLNSLGLTPGDSLHFWVTVERNGLQLQRFPAEGEFTVQVPSIDPGRNNWMV